MYTRASVRPTVSLTYIKFICASMNLIWQPATLQLSRTNVRVHALCLGLQKPVNYNALQGFHLMRKGWATESEISRHETDRVSGFHMGLGQLKRD